MLKTFLNAAVPRVWPSCIAPRVIYYHSIHPSAPFSMQPGIFGQHIDWLQANGFELVTFSQLIERVRTDDPNPRLACISFDDGYADNYEHALPILVDHHVPATFFVVTGMIGDRTPLPSNQGNKLYRDRLMLTQSQLKEMLSCGMEIGSHTRSHVHARATYQQSAQMLEDELAGSRKDLEDCLGVPVSCFAYPNGQKGVFDVNTAQQVQAAGYLYAATTIWGSVTPDTNPLEIPRMEIRFNDSLHVFERKLLGRYDYMRYYALAIDRSKRWSQQ